MSGPLAGRRVLVTRAAHQAGKLSEGLRALGAEPVEVPVLEIDPPRDYAPLDTALRQINNYDWLIITSANTVRAIVDRAAILDVSLVNAAMPQVAAVGEATANALRDAGFSVAIVPENYVAESLVEGFFQQPGSWRNVSRAEADGVKPGAFPRGSFRDLRILIARAEIARDVIPEGMRAAGALVDVVDAYRNVLPEAAPALLRTALEKGIDAATFTSSSSVTHLAAAAQAADVTFPFAGVPAISIGPITSASLREYGWEPAGEATKSDIGGLIAAACKALRGN
jgi:uroporphyrinogen-III synthase